MKDILFPAQIESIDSLTGQQISNPIVGVNPPNSLPQVGAVLGILSPFTTIDEQRGPLTGFQYQLNNLPGAVERLQTVNIDVTFRFNAVSGTGTELRPSLERTVKIDRVGTPRILLVPGLFNQIEVLPAFGSGTVTTPQPPGVKTVGVNLVPTSHFAPRRSLPKNKGLRVLQADFNGLICYKIKN